MPTTPHEEVLLRINGLLKDEDDWVTAMATSSTSCTTRSTTSTRPGFTAPCGRITSRSGPTKRARLLDIPFDQGICGAAANGTHRTCLMCTFDRSIACSSSTNSEVVVPVLAVWACHRRLGRGPDDPAAFDGADVALLESICTDLGRRYGEATLANIPGLT